jgi:hypothetical protein
MKTLRQLCAVTILTLALAVFVSAGEIDCPGVVTPPPPPPPPESATSSVTTTIILVIVSLTR